MSDWLVDVTAHIATHRQTGLVVEFTHVQGGQWSGTVRHPERVVLDPDDPHPETTVAALMREAGEAFAAAARGAGLASPLPAAAARVIREVVDLLSQSRHTFKSKQIERARQLLESLLRQKEK
jgi:hypothetical protein